MKRWIYMHKTRITDLSYNVLAASDHLMSVNVYVFLEIMTMMMKTCQQTLQVFLGTAGMISKMKPVSFQLQKL